MPRPSLATVLDGILTDATGNTTPEKVTSVLPTIANRLDRIPTAALFNLATQCIAEGGYSARDALYNLISTHPQVSQLDQLRIQIHRQDMARRTDASGASDAILAISSTEPSTDILVECERLQVWAMAYFKEYEQAAPVYAALVKLKGVHAHIDAAAEALRAALDVFAENALLHARKIISIMNSDPAISNDKKLFYLLNVVALSDQFERPETECEGYMRLYEEKIGNPAYVDASTPLGQRQICQYWDTKGSQGVRFQKPVQAAEGYYKSWQIAPDQYYGIGPAFRLLKILDQDPSLATRVGTTLAAVVNYLKEVESQIPDDAANANNRKWMKEARLIRPELWT
jgi:hypothetical protein